jgi:hypothetical protein
MALLTILGTGCPLPAGRGDEVLNLLRDFPRPPKFLAS